MSPFLLDGSKLGNIFFGNTFGGGLNLESVSIVLLLRLAGQGPADYPQRASKTSFERTGGP